MSHRGMRPEPIPGLSDSFPYLFAHLARGPSTPSLRSAFSQLGMITLVLFSLILSRLGVAGAQPFQYWAGGRRQY